MRRVAQPTAILIGLFFRHSTLANTQQPQRSSERTLNRPPDILGSTEEMGAPLPLRTSRIHVQMCCATVLPAR